MLSSRERRARMHQIVEIGVIFRLWQHPWGCGDESSGGNDCEWNVQPIFTWGRRRGEKTVTISLHTANMIRAIMAGRGRWLWDSCILISPISATDDSKCKKKVDLRAGVTRFLADQPSAISLSYFSWHFICLAMGFKACVSFKTFE